MAIQLTFFWEYGREGYELPDAFTALGLGIDGVKHELGAFTIDLEDAHQPVL